MIGDLGIEDTQLAAITLSPNPTNGKYTIDLGEAYVLLKDVPKAKSAFEKTVQLKPDSPEAREAKRALVRLQYIK